MSQILPKSHTLRTKKVFYETYSKNRKELGSFIVYWKENGKKFSRLAVVVSKKHGQATKRNKIKRRVREFFRTRHNREKARDFIIIPRLNRKLILHSLEQIIS